MLHAFSIDVEDWYQGIEIPFDQWDQYQPRVHLSMGRMLDLMARHGVQSTCFVLGKVAEDHPTLVRDLHQAGHEVATHGYAHDEVHHLTPAAFRDDLQKSIDLIETVTDEKVIGYRAPFFTITARSLWALPILVKAGIRYDSSIHPIYHFRYGIAGAERTPSLLETDAGRPLLELPVSTYPLLNKFNIPVGGGAYLRLYPYPLQKWFLKRLVRRGEAVRLYMHPWEIDVDHPRIALKTMLKARHYTNLKAMEPRLDKLFQAFEFAAYRTVYKDALDRIAPVEA